MPTVAIARTHFEIDEVATGSKKRIWSTVLNRNYFNFDSRFLSEFNTGRFEMSAFEDGVVSSFMCDAFSADRSREHVNKDGKDAYFIVFPHREEIVLKQRGREIGVGEDHFSFVSLTEPHAWRQTHSERFDVMLLPGPSVRARIPHFDDHAACSFAPSGMQKIFVDFAKTLCQNVGSLDERDLRIMLGNVIEMLSIVIDGADPACNQTNVKLAHKRRIIKAIEADFPNPDLCLPMISQFLGLSPRYIQRILTENGTSLSQLMRDRRINEACHLLDKKDLSRARIASIAYEVGFNDSAYFSKVFRAAKGISPANYAMRSR